jgi:hypothetical protein
VDSTPKWFRKRFKRYSFRWATQLHWWTTSTYHVPFSRIPPSRGSSEGGTTLIRYMPNKRGGNSCTENVDFTMKLCSLGRPASAQVALPPPDGQRRRRQCGRQVRGTAPRQAARVSRCAEYVVCPARGCQSVPGSGRHARPIPPRSSQRLGDSGGVPPRNLEGAQCSSGCPLVELPRRCAECWPPS